MFGIGTVIMMLDLRMNSSFGDKFVRLSEVVVAVDMLLRKSKLVTSQCALMNTLLVSEKRTLGIVLWGVVGSGMATISKFHPFINLQQVR
jgi:hypothetical protein